MNIITEIYPESESICIFYRSFPYARDLQQVLRSKEDGEKKCILIKPSNIKRLHLHRRGVTVRFNERESVKLYLHPKKSSVQIKNVAQIAKVCNLKALHVIEHFESVEINKELKKVV